MSPSPLPPSLPGSVAGVVSVELLRGAAARADARPELLIEVPHGADEQPHYDALRARLRGPFPAGLEIFFQVNTDVGAYAYGRAAAEEVLAAEPQRSALLVRSLIPRTFVDCNRAATKSGDPAAAVTAGIPAYVEDAADLALLHELHAAYFEVAEAAYKAVCGAGGVALVPHTYAPRSVGITSVGHDIVTQLREVYRPERVAEWPLRAEVELLTRDGEGQLLAPQGCEEALSAAFAAAGVVAAKNETFFLHPATLGHGWSAAYPGQTICLEVRRDLLVREWLPFSPKTLDPARVSTFARALAPTLRHALGGTLQDLASPAGPPQTVLKGHTN